MKEPIRIAISGKIASGKTTTSDYLVKEKGFIRYNFAKYVKALASAIADANSVIGKDNSDDSKKTLADAMNGLYDICILISKDEEEFDKVTKLTSSIMKEFSDVKDVSNKDHRVRSLLQAIGDGFTREVRADIWADITIKEMETKNPESNIVIDDLRYPHELDLLKEFGFVVVRLEVNEKIRLERINSLYKGITEEQLKNRGEKALDRHVYKGIRAFTLKDMDLKDIQTFLDNLINEDDN